ncbi:amidohydrolase family protein [Pleomorphovibrio marinus]|uniref:amidohydrolase family protein n=1 Tax=Pleomorphovibrio marinus TaxID=2164132 RepID=UPI001E4B5F1F|nr:amidohydrolase family protein [Pleomorphovibrio marinus]
MYHWVSKELALMKIDAHQHFWKYDPDNLPWIGEELKILKRDYLPKDLKPHLDHHGIQGCVAVQASQTDVETHFLLDLADSHDIIKGVVGWVDLEGKDLESKLDAYLPFRKLKGFRHILQDETDPEYILRPAFQNGLKILGNRGYSYDILVFPHQMAGAIKTLEKQPDTTFILDHSAKPIIREGKIQPWKELIQEMAKFPNLYCKLSGMVTENRWDGWEQKDFFPYLETVFEAFGEDRLMFGSDWPVCLLAASFSEVFGIVESFLSDKSGEVKNKIIGANAEKCYRLNL